ncbi:MAG: efflux RND transporter permease subunit [Thermovirgaceae bacterium]|nr:efflux RND transporter permease subunit [Thermovirgaceae bacterium]
MKLPELSVKRPVTTLMIFLSVLIIGGIASTSLKLDMLPKIEPPVVTILTSWPGASASDVEQRVSKVMEDNLSTIEGVDDIISKSLDNISAVSVKFKWGSDLDVRTADIRDAVTFAKRDLPSDSDEPVILRITSGMIPVVEISMTAERSWQGLYHFVDKAVVEDLSRIPGVGQILVYGGVSREIQVLLDAARLEAFRLSPEAVAGVLERENINVPAGSLKQGETEYFIRVPGRFSTVDEIRNVILGVYNGSPVRLGDVAEIRDGFKETVMNAWDGEKATVLMIVMKNSDANTVDVSRDVLGRLAELKKERFPTDVDYEILMNTADFIMNAIKSLGTSLLAGIILVFLVTWAFLKRFSASLVVAGAIPFSLIITFIVMGRLDYTINILTLSALAMASGMVVDNAIVATDQIIFHIEQGARRKVAAVLGAGEIGPALFASTLTTVVVLLPLAFISGLVGVFFSALTVVMVLAVSASLFVGLTFVPMMGSRFFAREPENFKIHQVTEEFFSWLEDGYSSVLAWSLANRKKVLAFSGLLLFLTFMGFRYIGTELVPDPDTGDISITFSLSEGTRLETTDELVREIVAHCRETIPEARIVFGFDGMEEGGFSIAVGQEAGANIGTVGLKLVDKSERKRSAFEIAEEIRIWIRTKPGIEDMTVLVSSPVKAMFLGSKPLSLEVFGDDLQEVTQAAEMISAGLAEIPGAVDISVSRKKDRPELWVEPDREKAAFLGVNTASIARTARICFSGYETSESFWEGDDDYPIRVRLKPEQRNSAEIFSRLTVPDAMGRPVKLSSVANLKDAAGPPQIERKNRQRYVTVGANIHGRALGEITQDALRMVEGMDIPGGVRVSFGGQIKEQQDAFRQMTLLFLLGIILVYMVMAAQYEAYLDPFVIMFSIPFALTGVAFAYLLTGIYLSMMGLLGIIMLVGIVVNIAIVLVDYINLVRARGARLEDAIIEACGRRLRPALMTTLTTFFGMLPMAVSRGQGAEMWRPLAISVMGGLMVSMLVTMLLVPVVYSIVEQKVRRVPRFMESKEGSRR